MALTLLTTMAAAIYLLDIDRDLAMTTSFCTLAFAQMWHVFNIRDESRQILRNDITGNGWIWVALAICTALILLAVYVPALADVPSLSDPGGRGWLLILGASLVPVIFAPMFGHTGGVRSRGNDRVT